MNDINHLDPNDEGLKAVMGYKFQDVTQGSQKTEAIKPKSCIPSTGSEERRGAEKLAKTSNAIHTTFLEPEKPNWLDSLKQCAKWTCLYATLSILIFYWSRNGLMDTSVAIPCNWICLLLTGFSIGRFFRGNK